MNQSNLELRQENSQLIVIESITEKIDKPSVSYF